MSQKKIDDDTWKEVMEKIENEGCTTRHLSIWLEKKKEIEISHSAIWERYKREREKRCDAIFDIMDAEEASKQTINNLKLLNEKSFEIFKRWKRGEEIPTEYTDFLEEIKDSIKIAILKGDSNIWIPTRRKDLELCKDIGTGFGFDSRRGVYTLTNYPLESAKYEVQQFMYHVLTFKGYMTSYVNRCEFSKYIRFYVITWDTEIEIEIKR